MKRNAALLTLFFAFAIVASFPLGVKTVTVEQLQQTLANASSTRATDEVVARQLGEMKLSARLTGTALERMTSMSPGPKTTQALRVIADVSAFMDPPSSQLPAIPAPDTAAQRVIVGKMISYVLHTMPALPNFLATRVTEQYADTLRGTQLLAELHGGFYFLGVHRESIAFREGKERNEPAPGDVPSSSAKKSGAKSSTARDAIGGMTSRGEFGPILGLVLLDAAKGKLAWERWETEEGKRIAVFQFSVDRSISHYQVNYFAPEYGQVLEDDYSDAQSTFIKPGFHGRFEVDPETGTVQRVTIEADMRPEDPVWRASMMVEYAPLKIGERMYVCPTRSVSISESQQVFNSGGVRQTGSRLLLNDVAFVDYHRFGSEFRLLEDGPPTSVRASEAAHDVSPATSSVEPQSGRPAAAQIEQATQAEAGPVVAEHEEASKTPVQGALGNPISSPPSDIAVKANQANPQVDMPTYKVAAHDVVVDVVVTKGNGDPVLRLGKQDFAVTEDGQPQAIDFFEEHTATNHAPAEPPAMPNLPPGFSTNLPPAALSDSVSVLLLDSLNTEQSDQVFVHQQIISFLTKLEPGTRVAIFTLGSKLRFVQGFTADTSILLAALKDQKNGVKAEKISRTRSDDADDASSIANLEMMRASPYIIATLRAAQADAGARDYAARATITLQALNYLGHFLAGVTGRKNLIWFANSFPVVLFPTVELRKSIKQNSNLAGYQDRVNQTADLFTVAKIAIYPIGASGVMTEHVAEAGAAGPGNAGGAGHSGSMEPDAAMDPYATESRGRANTIYAMQQLAASTGGKAFFNTNDLNGAMQSAIRDSSSYYTIGYSPTNKRMDGGYRQISIQSPEAKYKLTYRHGYNAESTPAHDARSGVDPLASLLELGLPGATGVLYGASITPASSQPAPNATLIGQNATMTAPFTRYRVDFVIRAQDLALAEEESGKRSGKILLGLKAYDRDGSAVNRGAREESFDMNARDYDGLLKTGVPVPMEIDLPANSDLHLVTAVYAWSTGLAGTLELQLHRDAATAAAVKSSTPQPH